MQIESGLAVHVQRLREVVAALGPARDVADRRRLLVLRSRAFPVPEEDGMSAVDDRVVLGDRQIAVRIFRPDGQDTQPLPLILYCHGGGFIAGDLETHGFICALLARHAGAVVLGVDYRLAPEHPFPAALDDCDAALAWARADAGRLGIDPSRIAVAGDSAGGALAASLAIRCRDRGDPELRCQALFYPVLDDDLDRPSYLRDLDPFLTRAAMRSYLDAYLPEPASRRDPQAIPMRVADPRGLAPAYVLAAELDPLRDEAHHFAARLAEAGVPTALREWPGTIHGFLRAQVESAASRAALADAAAVLRSALSASAKDPFRS